MSRVILALIALSLAGCASSATPPGPPEPNERERVPVNRSLPAELQGTTR